MAYRFQLDEAMAKGFRRIGRSLIAKAEDEFAVLREQQSAEATAVHETRKIMKRVRALLRLVRPVIGEAEFQAENARFRDIAQGLAGTRDAVVLRATLASLATDVPAGELSRASELVGQNGAPDIAADKGAIASARSSLMEAKATFRTLKLRAKGFDALAPGLEATYRRGRKRMERAFEVATDEAFHDWRKAVQHHWRHMQLVAEAWPEDCEARIATARELSQVLGRDHDLGVLATRIGHCAKDHSYAGLLSLIEIRQAEGRAQALLLGQRLYGERPKALTERLAACWTAARAEVRSGAANGESGAAQPSALKATAKSKPGRASASTQLRKTQKSRTVAQRSKDA